MTNDIFIGGGGEAYATKQFLNIGYANRHGLIAGATGTGKTVTLQILAEGFSAAGVPVFLSDVKGDLSGLAQAGSASHKLHTPFTERAQTIGFDDFDYSAFPVTFWDMYGKQGHPVRTTISEMGPLLLAQLLDLTEAQEGILNIAFRVADEDGLPLLDLKDLQSLLVWIGKNASTLALRYGNVSAASVGAIQRRLLVLENQGAADLFGEPALALSDLMRTDTDGRGFINILAADKLMQAPKLYATFLLWLLSELFEELPEVGDPEKPKLVFFFDEAHLLFDDAPKALVDKVEQGIPGVVERTLIRPPSSQLGPLDPATRAALMAQSPMAGKYDTRLDRASAFEMLAKRAEDAAKEAAQAEEQAEAEDTSPALREFNAARRYAGKRVTRSTAKRTTKSDDSFGGAIASVVIKELKGTTGRRIVRGILGGLFKGR